MPAGDATRAWFPQMIEELRKKWTPTLSWDEYAELAREMTRLRTEIRREKSISSPRSFCKSCGGTHGMELLPIGIRSILFTLKKAELLDDEQFSHLDKEWKRYQRIHRLDCLGDEKKQNKPLLPTGNSPTTSHPNHLCRPAAE